MSLEHFNPLLRTHQLVRELKWSRELRERFKADEAAFLRDFELSNHEIEAIRTRDFKALYEMGVHPYLLAQLSRLIYGTVEGRGASDAATNLVRSLRGAGALEPEQASR